MFFEYSAITPAATPWKLFTMHATHLATFAGFASALGALRAMITRLGTKCVEIWLSAWTRAVRNLKRASNAGPATNGEGAIL